MRRRLLALLVTGVAALSVAGDAHGHPHVFISDAMTLIFDDRDIAGLRLSWSFDEMYSSMIKTDYVHGRDPTPAEIKSIEKENFSNLANYGFFLDIKINDQPVKFQEVRDFTAKLQGNRVVFEFTVPLVTVERKETNIIEAGVFDPEYYVEFTMREADPVAIEHGEHFSIECNIQRNTPKISMLGRVNTDYAVCTYAPKH
jgi:ABC-type uncharacterized transport system substrate-binding protein